MTVHMVNIASENPSGATVSEIETAVKNWASNHDEVLTAQRASVSEVTDENGNAYLSAGFRFSMATDDKLPLLDDAEAALQNFVSWYRLKYHVCDHDEDSRQGCSWDDQREYGTVPSYVP